MSIEQIFMIIMMFTFVLLFIDRGYELNTNYSFGEEK